MWSRRAAFGAIAASLGAPALAQRGAEPPIVGYLSLGTEASQLSAVAALRAGFRENGLTENVNVQLVTRYADNQPERLEGLVRELMAAGVRVIVTTGTTAVSAAHRVAATLPVVMAGSADPVQMGFAQSLARPGGRVTGISILGAEIVSKQLQLLRDVVPQGKVFAGFLHAANPGNPALRANLEAAARGLGLGIALREIADMQRLDEAFDWTRQQAASALYVVPDPVFYGHARTLFRLAIEHRLPTMTGNMVALEAGALLAYSVDFGAMARRSAYYVREILRGIEPSMLPIEQPTGLTLGVNLGTARTLGLVLPPALLAQVTMTVE
jgi:putative ABC transport system substrate-binding protein